MIDYIGFANNHVLAGGVVLFGVCVLKGYVRICYFCCSSFWFYCQGTVLEWYMASSPFSEQRVYETAAFTESHMSLQSVKDC
eukprot:6360855-Amphidinium_carterae.2